MYTPVSRPMYTPIERICATIKTKWHLVSIVGWAPFDLAGKMEQQSILTNIYVAALHKLAPDMGAYVNEVWCCPELF